MLHLLSPDQSRQLLSLPETGMGYQIIEAVTSGSYQKHIFTVLNAEFAIAHDKDYDHITRELFRLGFSRARTEVFPITFSSIKLFSEKDLQVVHEPGVPGERSAIENPKESADGNICSFIRF